MRITFNARRMNIVWNRGDIFTTGTWKIDSTSLHLIGSWKQRGANFEFATMKNEIKQRAKGKAAWAWLGARLEAAFGLSTMASLRSFCEFYCQTATVDRGARKFI